MCSCLEEGSLALETSKWIEIVKLSIRLIERMDPSERLITFTEIIDQNIPLNFKALLFDSLDYRKYLHQEINKYCSKSIR